MACAFFDGCHLYEHADPPSVSTRKGHLDFSITAAMRSATSLGQLIYWFEEVSFDGMPV